MATELFSRAALRAGGLSDDQIDRRLGNGRLIAVRRGLLSRDVAEFTDELTAITLAHGSRSLVVSHRSAARLLELPRPLAGWDVPELTSATGPTRKHRGLRITVAALPESDIDRNGDLPTTTPPRTLADCLRLLPPRDGLAVIDAALHRHLVTAAQVEAVLAHQVRWPGVKRARTVLALADGRRESPLESWSAWAFEQAGLPRPEWQVDLFGPDGQFAGRCDCWWPGLAGEADGRSKYRLQAAERGGADADTLFAILEAERQRESLIRDQVGAELIRWGAAHVLTPHRTVDLAHRIRTKLSLRRPLRGTARPNPNPPPPCTR